MTAPPDDTTEGKALPETMLQPCSFDDSPEPTTAPVTADCVCGTCDMSTCSCDCHGIVDESATVVGGRRLGTAPVTAEDLRERIAWLRDRWYERPGLSEQADALDAALDEFAEDAARQAAEVERLRAAKRQLSERISIGQEGWNEIARERDALTTELEHARGNLTDARGEIDALTEENRGLRDERDLLRETLAESDLGAQVLAQWEAIAAADADRDRLEAQVAALQRECDRLAEEADANMKVHFADRAERDAVVAAVRTAQITHIRDAHPDRMHHPDCGGCWVFLGLSRDLPSRPDDPEEIRRLAQATTEETNDG